MYVCMYIKAKLAEEVNGGGPLSQKRNNDDEKYSIKTPSRPLFILKFSYAQ